MNLNPTAGTRSVAAILTMGIGLLAGDALAHCDSLNGPVIPEARLALESGDIGPVLKWIKPAHEAEITAAFGRAVAVRALGGEAAELADRYFLETLIRLHRAGEGAPYTGLKDVPLDPIVAMADQALASGSAEEMIGKIGQHLASAIAERFLRALEAGRSKDRSVEAGREYVEAYVTYVHYVEAVHDAIVASGAHPAAGDAGGESHLH